MSCHDHELDEAVLRGLEQLHDVELFLDLRTHRVQQLWSLRHHYPTPPALRSVIEMHLREPGRATHPDPSVALIGPGRVSAFTAVLDVSTVLVADDDPQLVHVDGVLVEPESYDEWVGCCNEALAIVGDDRRFVAFNGEDFYESLYVLVTDEQRDVLFELGLATMTPIRPCAVSSLQGLTRLSRKLVDNEVAARVEGAQLVLDLDLASATALLDAVREIHGHDADAVRAQLRAVRGPERVPLTVRAALLLDRLTDVARR